MFTNFRPTRMTDGDTTVHTPRVHGGTRNGTTPIEDAQVHIRILALGVRAARPEVSY